jgi:hypothetical protein
MNLFVHLPPTASMRNLSRNASLLAFGLLLCSPAVAQAQEKTQDVSLALQNTSIDLKVPESWGKSTPISNATADETTIYVPVIDDTTEYIGAAWNTLVPKEKDADQAPSVTISLAIIPPKFTDDPEISLPQEERPPYALTAKQKEEIIKPLETIYKDSAVDVEKYRAPEMEPVKGLEGAWWGNMEGVLDILDIHYIENQDKSLRGISYLFTDGGDINFSVSARIVLYSPERHVVLLLDCPMFTFPEIDMLNQAVGAAGEGPGVLAEYKKGLAYIRDRKSWATTPMGKLLQELEDSARSAVIKKQ